MLRSDNGGQLYTQIAQVIPETDYKAQTNELGNLVDRPPQPAQQDRRVLGLPGVRGAIELLGHPQQRGIPRRLRPMVVTHGPIRPIPCSTASAVDRPEPQLPQVSVDPPGHIWYAWSDDTTIRTAESTNHGKTWTCSKPVSTTTAQAIFPWLVATSHGVDLVYYGAPTKTNQTWYVYFVQNPAPPQPAGARRSD